MDRRSLSDENIEDILRQHLRAEVEAIPPETNPWERLRDRLPRQHKKFLGLFDLSLGSAARPALAAAAVLVSGYRRDDVAVPSRTLGGIRPESAQ